MIAKAHILNAGLYNIAKKKKSNNPGVVGRKGGV